MPRSTPCAWSRSSGPPCAWRTWEEAPVVDPESALPRSRVTHHRSDDRPGRARYDLPARALLTPPTTQRSMYFDEFKHQLPDVDPNETAEWLASFDQLVEQEGESRARFLVYKLLKHARQLHVGLPPLTQTRYINTISPEQEPNFPGDESIELRIRRIIRWNAVAMVLRANTRFPGLGGHLATYASAASLYEVGFNHFFRGKDGEGSGDQIFYQGHAAPGIYARAFLEGRLTEDQLDNFRRETVPGGVCRPTRIRACCRTSGSSRPSVWGSGRYRPSTRPTSTVISRTEASLTPPSPGSGLSSATARPMSRSRSARSASLRAKAS